MLNILYGLNDCFNACMEMISTCIWNIRLRWYWYKRRDKYTLDELMIKEFGDL